MGLGPITYAEIEAYLRLTLDDLTSWEIALIRRLDDAVRGVIAPPKPPGESTTSRQTPNGTELVPVSDVRSVKGLFRATAQAAQLKARKSKGNENG